MFNGFLGHSGEQTMVVVESACDKCTNFSESFFNISKMKERGLFNTVDMTVAVEASINSDTKICGKFCRTEREGL